MSEVPILEQNDAYIPLRTSLVKVDLQGIEPWTSRRHGIMQSGLRSFLLAGVPKTQVTV